MGGRSEFLPCFEHILCTRLSRGRRTEALLSACVNRWRRYGNWSVTSACGGTRVDAITGFQVPQGKALCVSVILRFSRLLTRRSQCSAKGTALRSSLARRPLFGHPHQPQIASGLPASTPPSLRHRQQMEPTGTIGRTVLSTCVLLIPWSMTGDRVAAIVAAVGVLSLLMTCQRRIRP